MRWVDRLCVRRVSIVNFGAASRSTVRGGIRCAFPPYDDYSPAGNWGFGGVMALLIVNLDKQIGNAQAWHDNFAAQLPDLEIRIWPEAGNVADIEYLAFIRPISAHCRICRI